MNNAKIYNDKKSLVYEDAERLRKTASNWMTKHNPAYRIKGYQAVATPIPGEEAPAPTPARAAARVSASTPRNPPATPATPEVATERPRRAAAPLSSNTPMPSRLRQSQSAAPTSAADGSFEGKTFQQAQEQIINSLIEYQEYVCAAITTH